MLDEEAEDDEGDDGDDDEESGEPACPICDAELNCKHIVAFFEGGPTCEDWCGVARWDDYEAVVRTHFAPLLTGGSLKGVRWSNDDVQELWKCALESTPAEQRWADIEIDAYVLARLVREALADAGADEVEGVSHSGGAEWPATAFFAQRPKSVFKASLAALDAAFAPAAPKPPRRRQKKPPKPARRR